MDNREEKLFDFNGQQLVKSEVISLIRSLITSNKFYFEEHCYNNAFRHGFSIKLLRRCLHKGQIFHGTELYKPDHSEYSKRSQRWYFIHKPWLFDRKLVLIATLVRHKVKVCHVQPLDAGSIQGRIFYKTLLLE